MGKMISRTDPVILENSRDVGVKLPKSVLQQVEELEEA